MMASTPLIDFDAAGAIDTTRLVKAMTLRARRLGQGRYRIDGGSEPHFVDLVSPDVPRCDCGDHLYRDSICKHMLAALICERHPAVFDAALAAVKGMVEATAV